MTAARPVLTDLRPPLSDRRNLPLLAALAFAVAAQILLATLYGAAHGVERGSWTAAITVLLLLCLPGFGVLWAVWTARSIPVNWRVGMAVVVTGVLMRTPYFGAGPMLEDDHFRYLLDGAFSAHGLSPYAFAPKALLSGAGGAQLPLVQVGRTVIEAINFPELRSIYPGGAQALFAVAHWLAPWSLDGVRVIIFGAEALAALLIWRLLVSSGRSPLLTALYWCNPLMTFCLTGQAHIDAALAPPILLALFAVRRRSAAGAGLCLGIAVGMKLWPLLLAPLLARVLWPDRRSIAIFVAMLGVVTLALCGPLLWTSLGADAGLTAYAGGWSVNNAPYAWASYLVFLLVGSGAGEAYLRVLVALAAVGASLIAAAQRPAGFETMVARAAILAAVLFYLSPAQFPWYAAWFLPLAAASGSWSLSAASVGLPIYFLFFPLAAAGLRDLHGYGLAFLHLTPLLLVALLRRPWGRTGEAA